MDRIFFPVVTTDTTGWSVVGGSTAHEVLSDGSDDTYAENTSTTNSLVVGFHLPRFSSAASSLLSFRLARPTGAQTLDSVTMTVSSGSQSTTMAAGTSPATLDEATPNVQLVAPLFTVTVTDNDHTGYRIYGVWITVAGGVLVEEEFSNVIPMGF